MDLLFSLYLMIGASQPSIDEAAAPSTPSSVYDYSSEILYQTYGFLSGITTDRLGIVVCNHQGNQVIRLTWQGEVETIADTPGSPVDVEYVDGEYWILLNDPPVLMAWNIISQERRILFIDFERESNLTAFAVASRDIVYAADFGGTIYRLDLVAQTNTIAYDGLDNPADIAILSEGEIAVTEQVGLDAQNGRIRFFLSNGQDKMRELISYELIDPTGLAAGPDGSVYVSVFFNNSVDSNDPDQIPVDNPDSPAIPDLDTDEYYGRTIGGIYRFSSWTSQPQIVARGLRGPTSLAITPEGTIVVIEEPSNSILSVSVDGTLDTLFRGTWKPLAMKIFVDGVTAYLTTNEQNVYLEFAVGESRVNVWTFAHSDVSVPQIELGGDGLLYVYDPQFSEILLFQSNGRLTQSYTIFLGDGEVPYLMTDPTGGIALFAWISGVLHVQKVNRDSMGDVVEYDDDFSSLIYLDEEGTIQDAKRKNSLGDDVLSHSTIAVDANGDIWYIDDSGDVYRVSGNQTERIAENLGSVRGVSPDGDDGLNVTLENGRVIHLYPSTPVSRWCLF